VVDRSAFIRAKWWVIVGLTAGVIGSAAAFFLWALDAVTRVRFSAPGLIFLLPVVGWVMGVIYQRYGKSAEAGTNLLIDEIHEPGAGVPRRMAPLILFGTLLTHLFGGSAGREGTALQMGGGIAAIFARWFKLDVVEVRLLLMAGVAAGFGSVFGTPIAGAVFAVEVLVVGGVRTAALMPCFAAALAADWICRAWGGSHTVYPVVAAPSDVWLLGKVLLGGVAFGLAARLFAAVSHGVSGQFKARISRPELRPVVGGFLVLGLLFLCGSSDYLGLGVLGSHPGAVTLSSLFTATPISSLAWLWKLVFTVVTLSSGFKGGEVTPLFFIGAALGHSLAVVMGAPVDLFAALGFVAIFAGASKTPISSTLLGLELFGAQNGIYLAAACLVAYHCSGQRGIYRTQRSASNF
jgi:H+/Cl- antiporter ClcA